MKAEVQLGRVAHGGVVVGRIDDKVIFVTGGLPGERVIVEITEKGRLACCQSQPPHSSVPGRGGVWWL